MKELYTRAATRNVGKDKAFKTLENMCLKMDDAERRQNMEHLADLMSFFTPKPTGKKAKSPLEWVNLAISKEETRYYLCTSYSDGEYLVATDGSRLHRTPTELPKGYYDSLGNAIELDGTFPEYNKLFFDTENKLEVTLDVEKATIEKYGKKWYYIFNIEDAECGFNKKYFDDALNGKTKLTGHIDVDIELLVGEKETKEDAMARRINRMESSPFQSADKSLMLMPVRLSKVRG